MKTSQKGIDLIKEFEGFREHAYQCAAGVWTIGYGHTLGVKKGDIITEKDAERFLKQDVKTAEIAVDSTMTQYNYDFNQNQFDALVSFTYNCGVGNLSRLTQSGKRDMKQISCALLLYINAGGRPLPGLVRRREAEQRLFDAPIDTEDDIGEFYPAYNGKGTNLDTILAGIGVSPAYYGNYIRRKPLAERNGIPNYKGTYQQNMTLINLARAGRLKRV